MKRFSFIAVLLLVSIAFTACDNPIVPPPTNPPITPTTPGDDDDNGPPVSSVGCQVTAVPADVRQRYNLRAFYQQYTDANGIPVLSSQRVNEEALERVCGMVTDMLSVRDDARRELERGGMFMVVIGIDEQTTDVPEYAHFGSMYNRLWRSVGSLPTACGEENALCDPSDRWKGESICIHEFAHAIMGWGLERIDPNFNSRLNAAYAEAQRSGRFANTYAISQKAEFWAENVQNWYNTNIQTPSGRPDGTHNNINTRAELREASPLMYELLADNFPENPQLNDCYQNAPY